MWCAGVERVRCAVFAGLIGLFAATAAACAEPASLIIVFDGSGSMWGTLEGSRTTKLALARDALRQALAKVAPQSRVGLASFGHRRGDCGDVEIMRAIEPLNADRILEPLDKLNPKGRGPLTSALREAAKSLATAPGKRSLLLIHDDADNCQQNVCAAAEELKAAGITVNVVGLGVKPDDIPKMACLPQITGGRVINTTNEQQIGPAVEEALLASADAGVQAPALPTAGAPAPPATSLRQDGPPGLALRAVLAAKGDAIGSPLLWTITPEGGAVPIYSGRAVNPQVAVPPGRYAVEAQDGPVAAKGAIAVGDKGLTPVDLVLDAGTLRVRALAQKTSVLLSDAVISISDAGPGAENRKDAVAGAPVAVFLGGEAGALLRAGRYVVRVDVGLVRAERSVVVPAGSQGRIDVTLNAARVQLAAATPDAKDPIVFSVVEDDPDAAKGRREVARTAARQADFALPPGTYHVIARQGNVEARERLALAPGDVVRRTLSLPGGRLTLSTRLAGAEASGSEPVSYRIERLDGAAPEVVTTSRASPVLFLNAGRYRVEALYGMINARSVREVEVRAGQVQQLTLEQQAGTLKPRLVGAGAAAAGDVFWDVRDDSGRTVWTTGQAEPSAALQAGRYRVRAETRDKRYERLVELQAGETAVAEVIAD